MTSIQPIGTLNLIDDSGFIVNMCNLDKVAERYLPIIEDIKGAYLTHNLDTLHSIYLRGSVAKGGAIDGGSDVDTLAISKCPVNEVDTHWKKDFAEMMCRKYPFITGVELHFDYIADVLSSKPLQFLYKTQCIAIYGEDVRKSLPRFKPGKDAYAHLPHLEKELQEIEEEIRHETDQTELEAICEWLMKRLVRTGFELVMEREQAFTRDLYPCYQVFSKYYPTKREAMEQTLFYAINPTGDRAILVNQINTVGKWLVREIRRKHNV